VLKIEEVYEKQVKLTSERPDGTEYAQFQKVYATRECLLNEEYIVSVHPHEFTSSSDYNKLEGRFPEGTKFSLFVVDGNSFRSSEMLVVGSFEKFARVFGDK
jgi:hypothetical protein